MTVHRSARGAPETGSARAPRPSRCPGSRAESWGSKGGAAERVGEVHPGGREDGGGGCVRVRGPGCIGVHTAGIYAVRTGGQVRPRHTFMPLPQIDNLRPPCHC